MAFKYVSKPLVWWPVTIQVPIDGGKTEKQECSAQFEILPATEYEEFKQLPDVEFLSRVVKAFGDDIQDEAGEPLPCTEEFKAQLFNSAGYVRIAFITAYHNAATGYLEKN